MSYIWCRVFFFNDTATTEIYTLSLHDALPIYRQRVAVASVGEHELAFVVGTPEVVGLTRVREDGAFSRSEEHTSELQSRQYLVCRLLLEKKNDLDLSIPSLHSRHAPFSYTLFS